MSGPRARGWGRVAPRRLPLALLAALPALPALPAVLRAQGPALRIAAADTAVRDVDPGGVTSVAFVVTNAGAAAITAATRLALPPGWRAVAGAEPAGPVTLAAGARELRLVGIRVAPDAHAGRYAIVLAAAAGRAGDGVGDSVVVRVRERRRLELTPVRAPAYVAAGEPFTVVFAAVNRGNVEAPLRLNARAGAGLTVEGDSLPLRLAAGERRELALRVHTDAADLPEGGRRPVTLRIQTAGQGADTVVWASASQSVTLLPPAAAGGDLAYRLPTSLRLRGTSGAGTTGKAGGLALDGVAWSGSGPLADGGATSVDFLASWSRWGVSPFGERDAYRLTVTRPGLELRLGDQFYGLSPLTELGRYASGAGASLARGAWSAGGFVSRDRWTAGDARRERAAFLRLQPDSGVEASVHYFTVAGPVQGSVWSTRALVARSPLARLDMELGFGGPGSDASAWVTELSGARRWLSYRVRLLRADSSYPGPVAGLDERSVRVAVAPWRALRLTTWTDHRTTTPTAYRPLLAERFATSGVGLDVAGRLGLEYRRDALQGESWGVPSDARDEALRLQLAGGRAGLRLSGSAEVGRVRDRARSATSPFQRYVLDAALTPRDGYVLSVFADHQRGRTLHVTSGAPTTTLGATATLAPTPRTSVTLSAYTELARAAARPWRQPAQLELYAAQELLLGHRLSARLRLTAAGAPGAPAPSVAQLDYAIPLGTPVGHRRDVGRFTARVTDAETGRGLPGVLLRLGTMTLVTDGDGRVAPVAVGAGVHGLRLEHTGAWLDRVPATDLPAAVTIAEGRTSRVDVALARAARVSGRVRRFAAVGAPRPDAAARHGEPRALADSAGVAGLVVTLTRGDAVVRQVTDADGAFAFAGLVPGRWMLHVTGDLPPFHELERDTAAVEVAPGEAADVALRVLPRVRTVRMVAQGELRASGAAPAATTRRYVTTTADRTLADVARRLYGDAARWPRLWLANRDAVPDPWVLREGTTLVVPPDGPLTPAERAAAARFRKGFPGGRNR
ncbi:MAG TPA: hypothetical protein VFS08_00060 [Gemmatimonadaceae bacterium]|nr:hypothetical protein [Gemmatimonadaceae bacterium]